MLEAKACVSGITPQHAALAETSADFDTRFDLARAHTWGRMTRSHSSFGNDRSPRHNTTKLLCFRGVDEGHIPHHLDRHAETATSQKLQGRRRRPHPAPWPNFSSSTRAAAKSGARRRVFWPAVAVEAPIARGLKFCRQFGVEVRLNLHLDRRERHRRDAGLVALLFHLLFQSRRVHVLNAGRHACRRCSRCVAIHKPQFPLR